MFEIMEEKTPIVPFGTIGGTGFGRWLLCDAVDPGLDDGAEFDVLGFGGG